ncbi:hypothetical protein [Zarconia navalis]|nr:hypothetical protein [Zarconia navalis]
MIVVFALDGERIETIEPSFGDRRLSCLPVSDTSNDRLRPSNL